MYCLTCTVKKTLLGFSKIASIGQNAQSVNFSSFNFWEYLKR
jgi:hypothetical protein